MPPHAVSGGSYDFYVPHRCIRSASRWVSAGRGAAALTDGASRTNPAEKFKYNAKAESGEELVTASPVPPARRVPRPPPLPAWPI